MGGGEYNNLGHYCLYDTKTGKQINRIKTIDLEPEIDDDGVTDNGKILGAEPLVAEVKLTNHSVILLMQLVKSNNWLKSHGYPMRRKVRR